MARIVEPDRAKSQLLGQRDGIPIFREERRWRWGCKVCSRQTARRLQAPDGGSDGGAEAGRDAVNKSCDAAGLISEMPESAMLSLREDGDIEVQRDLRIIVLILRWTQIYLLSP